MADFIPANSLEIALRNLLRDRHTPVWTFYTPLGAARLWFFAKHYPELDGSDRVAPEGQNPQVVVLEAPGRSDIGVYTAEPRAEQAFKILKLDPTRMTIVSAQGYELLRYLKTFEASLWLNLFLPECQKHLDPELLDILLERPAPPPLPDEPEEVVDLYPAEDPQRYLGPIRDFLATQPEVRAAWVMARKPDKAKPATDTAYEIYLLMRDPEDESLLDKVCTMAKALTPVEMEWSSGVMMADENSLRQLAKDKPPLYQAADFLR